VEIAERSAYYGISLNLITYLTGRLHQSTAAAAVAINAWSGVASMLPLIGAFIADSYLGRYRMIAIASGLYVLGLGMLTLSTILTNLHTHSQLIFFYFSLYLVAFAQGGHKPCTQAFGADQFDDDDPDESEARSSFFNWWYFGMNVGIIASLLTLSYVQDNVSWGLGFGIPCILMVVALVVFLMGTRTYRYYLLEEENPFGRVGRAFVALVRSWRASWWGSSRRNPESNKAAGIANDALVQEAKEVIRLIPIWASCLIYATVFAQSSTLFTKQGSTLDRRIGPHFKVPPAALQSFIGVSIIVFIPIYDRVLIPISRKFTKLPSGITVLQRIGVGMLISTMSMIIAALVEKKRLKIVRNLSLINKPKEPVPMSLWWLVPQYVLFGVADVFTVVGLQEFFYDQLPDGLRSLGLALYLSIFGIGSFISSFLVSIIDGVTEKNGESWFSNNLNRAHLDYFYWLLAGFSALGVLVYPFLASAYVYKKKHNSVV
ncbi:uncharacterized protein A4U43_C10F10510, partial [Asparagus officinalis]